MSVLNQVSITCNLSFVACCRVPFAQAELAASPWPFLKMSSALDDPVDDFAA
jgi:hypothetical protein